MDQAAISSTAEGFVSARKNHVVLAQYPGQRPGTLADAYAVQDAALTIWGAALPGRQIGGWKVGRINPPDDALLGTDRLAGPIFRECIQDASDAPDETSPKMPVFAGGFAAVEGEFMLRLAIPHDAAPPPETDQDTIGWISEIRVGIEIASSPYGRINAEGPLVTISDHGNNFGLLLGPNVPREMWTQLDAIDVSMDIGGEQVGRGSTATMLDGPLGAVRFLLRNMADRKIPLQDGWWISTGAVTGVHQIAIGQSARARFAGTGTVDCIISAAA